MMKLIMMIWMIMFNVPTKNNDDKYDDDDDNDDLN